MLVLKNSLSKVLQFLKLCYNVDGDNMDLYSFYNSILNIGNTSKEVITKIVLEEKKKLEDKTSNLDGFCKYIANQIDVRLKELNIKTYKIDLKNIVDVDHVVLIAEYKVNDQIKRLLIDPTFSQFQKSENKILVKLDKWPSDKLDSSILNPLLENGVIDIDNNIFNKYINAFSNNLISINLDEYLINLQLDSLGKNKR